MRPATKSLEEIAYRRPLRDCGIEELAVHQITANPSCGILFARKSEHEQKDLARDEVVKLFSLERHPGKLNILTMPGLKWTFEGALLAAREGKWKQKPFTKRTFITACESDRVIYHAAMLRMPGIGQPSCIMKVRQAPFAERAIRNPWIQRFFFTNVDNFMREQCMHFGGAWLDYTGPLSIQRMETIARFYAERMKGTLAITSLKARWNRDTVHAIDRAGGISSWVRAHIPGTVLHDIEYQDGASPMHQIAIQK